jgi:pSer/pThr/pTyr-binding forkhead associated (FHA) protein
MPTLVFKPGDEPAGGNVATTASVPPPIGAKYWLQDDERTYPLIAGVNMLGRLPDSDVVIQEPDVSRRQCIIVVSRGPACTLHDNGSRNGTYVNGRQVEGSTELASGDVISIGRRQFMFLSKVERLG